MLGTQKKTSINMNYFSLSIHKSNQELTLFILIQKEVFSQFVLIASHSLSFFFLMYYLFVFWLHWALGAVSGLFRCTRSLKLQVGFLQLQRARATLSLSVGFSSWWFLWQRSTSYRLEGFSSCRAQMPCSMWNLSRPGVKPLHWQVDSQPLDHQENPLFFIIIFNAKKCSISAVISLLSSFLAVSPLDSVPFTQSYPALCSPMDCSMPGFPVYHQLQELA